MGRYASDNSNIHVHVAAAINEVKMTHGIGENTLRVLEGTDHTSIFRLRDQCGSHGHDETHLLD